MLIYRNDGTLYCISQKALKLAGYGDIAQFMDEHEDYSELFVKKPGYIYKFENFSWLSFLRNANTENKRVLISTRDNAIYECELEMELIYPLRFDEHTPEFYYQINFKNLRLSNGTALPEEFGEFSEASMAATIDIDRDLIEKEYQAFEGHSAPAAEFAEESVQIFAESEASEAPVFGEPAAEREEERVEPNLTFDVEEPREEALSLSFDSVSAEEPKEEAKEEALDLMDFSFEEESREEESAIEEVKGPRPLSFDDEALDNAFAELKPPSESREIPQSAEEKAPKEERPAAELPPFPTPEAAPRPSEEMPDLRKVAATLGLPETMVKAFVKEFVETFLKDSDEVAMAMKSGHLPVVKKEALKLKGIAANLMMEPLVASLEEVLETKSSAALAQKWERVESYIRNLGHAFAPEAMPAPRRLPAQTDLPSSEGKSREPETAEESRNEETGMELVLEETATAERVAFDPNEAANALGLPESLIIEFVNDFVTQAREEKKSFEEAFAAGDLKRVNETAHKLKGVAANLRIEEMRELMERAQHAATLEEARDPLVAFYKKLGALDNTMAKEFA